MIDIGKDLQKAFDDGYKARDAEIVRCKDCKWFKEFTNNGVTIGNGCCDNPSIRMAKCPQADWYCADGVRKDG